MAKIYEHEGICPKCLTIVYREFVRHNERCPKCGAEIKEADLLEKDPTEPIEI